MSSRQDRLKKNPFGMSPATRQVLRERAESAALAEVEKKVRLQREKSAKLKKLRLSQDSD